MGNKAKWQRADRQSFVKVNGFSRAANYACGGKRRLVLERDGYRCVKCGMSDEEHRQQWERPITVDHKDKNRKNNDLTNLQTLCLSCHGSKDITPALIVWKFDVFKETALRLRAEGKSYRAIAITTGFSIGAVWKWIQRWTAQAKV